MERTLIKIMKNIKYISIKNLFKDLTKSESMISLANSIELAALIRVKGNYMISCVFTHSVKYANRSRQLHNFMKYLFSIRRRHGSTFVVHYLKAAQLAVQKAIAGNEVDSLSSINPKYRFPRLSRGGLPKIIPVEDRRSILLGHTSIIR